VFGRPFPADGQTLDINEWFSVRLTRDLLCYNPALVSQVFVQNISSPGMETEVPFNVICSGNTLLFAFSLAADFEAMMGRRLKAMAYGVMDVTGNWLNGAREQSVSWSFFAPSVDLALQSVRLSMAISNSTSVGQPGDPQMFAWKNNFLRTFASLLRVSQCRLECLDPYYENKIHKADLIIRPVMASPDCVPVEGLTPYAVAKRLYTLLVANSTNTSNGRRLLLQDPAELSAVDLSQPISFRFGEAALATGVITSCANGRALGQVCEAASFEKLCCQAPLSCVASVCVSSQPGSIGTETSMTPQAGNKSSTDGTKRALVTLVSLLFVAVLCLIAGGAVLYRMINKRLGYANLDQVNVGRLGPEPGVESKNDVRLDTL
jgi:hypothetical protein